MTDQFVEAGVGSYDWNGGTAPAGGAHTGQCVLTMQDGATFTVAHSRTEALQKVSVGAQPSNPGGWVAFDVPSGAVPLVLNAALVATVR